MRWRAPAIAVVVVIVAIWGRVWLNGRDALATATEHVANGQTEQAIAHFQYAMRAYTPFAAALVAAADALSSIAQAAQTSGDRTNALRALRRLRGGILSTRWLVSPFGDRLDAVNRRLATLTADEQLALGQSTIRGRDRAQLETDHLALLQLDPTPSPAWSLLVVLGFLGWVGGAYTTIARGMDRQARPQWRSFARWAGFTAACFAGWVVGLMYA